MSDKLPSIENMKTGTLINEFNRVLYKDGKMDLDASLRYHKGVEEALNHRFKSLDALHLPTKGE